MIALDSGGASGHDGAKKTNTTLALLLLTWCGLAPAALAQDDCLDYQRTAAERIAACTQALTAPNLNPIEKDNLLYNRGWAHSDRAEYPEAEADLSASLADASFTQRLAATLFAGKDPTLMDEVIPYGNALRARSWVRSVLGREDEAIEDAKSAERWFQSPQMDSEAYAAIAWAERLKGDVERADADYRKSFDTYGDNSYAEFIYATMLFDLGKTDDALARLRHSIKVDDSFGYGAFWLYDNGADRDGEGKEALPSYLGAATSDARPAPVAHFYLGEIDADAVLKAAAEAPTPTKSKENLCEAHYYIAEALRLAGKTDAARMEYQAVIDSGVTYYVEYESAKQKLASP